MWWGTVAIFSNLSNATDSDRAMSRLAKMIALASAYKLNGDFDMALEVLKSAAEEKPEIYRAFIEPLEQEMAENSRNSLSTD